MSKVAPEGSQSSADADRRQQFSADGLRADRAQLKKPIVCRYSITFKAPPVQRTGNLVRKRALNLWFSLSMFNYASIGRFPAESPSMFGMPRVSDDRIAECHGDADQYAFTSAVSSGRFGSSRQGCWRDVVTNGCADEC